MASTSRSIVERLRSQSATWPQPRCGRARDEHRRERRDDGPATHSPTSGVYSIIRCSATRSIS